MSVTIRAIVPTRSESCGCLVAKVDPLAFLRHDLAAEGRYATLPVIALVVVEDGNAQSVSGIVVRDGRLVRAEEFGVDFWGYGIAPQ